MTRASSGPEGRDHATVSQLPQTLAIDLGGSKLKAAVLDPDGALIGERVRTTTPYPCPPETLLRQVVALVRPLPWAPRISVGFPGMVRDGRVRSATAYVRAVKDGPTDAALRAAWDRFPLEASLAQVLQRPVRLANAADVQGCAVISGVGLELVVTLGTGVGTALFQDGQLLPHLELSHAPFHDSTFDLLLGKASRKRHGAAQWSAWVHEAIGWFDRITFFDHLHLGGGGAKWLAGPLPDRVTRVSNLAGILGGAWLWERGHVRPAARGAGLRNEGSTEVSSR